MAVAKGNMFSGDREELDFGAGACPGRPGQVIRLHPKTRQHHLDLLIPRPAGCGSYMGFPDAVMI